MKLEHEFIQLPHKFEVERLQQEVQTLPRNLWIPHHEGFQGNYSIPLVSRGGLMNNDFKGAMACTKILDQCLYLRQVIASFGEVVGRSRLMGLDAGCQVPVHSDINYHWYKRVRIHVPIITQPEVIFHCGERQLHMQAGDAWIFDSWKYHQVKNDSSDFRVHLVIDVCGSAEFWQQTRTGAVPWIADRQKVQSPKLVNYKAHKVAEIRTEQFNVPLVMSPGEVDGLAGDLLRDVQSVVTNDTTALNEFVSKVNDFGYQWRCLWTLYGMQEQGWAHYQQLRHRAFESVKHLDTKLRLQNGTQATRMFLNCIIDPALNVEVKDSFLSVDNTRDPQQSVQKTAPSAVTAASKSGSSTPTAQRTISRNDPCHCGSKLKFKACHGKLS
ncbi:aspartyl/asparaginyl beta-hydroxylase domain-containing protein [Aliiglaciecola sp. LCG003]|uniref:aspartyl/asparaginyl beta-hydroxylase domain-containing protein n=1 Tax=Aliiglaciecola sp. LCG003 TaxID=3053655 RepID=UPI002573F8CA|nr:aspartyl/asparaginyl beta-hydroxylase domain-containing protein [Aliiglaciecola sp. LCG003]WJG08353.1 aspartyl/asparaginyl beta-hydroxylase domain-containing protein [Aliiglaciecola sp. LCG003]